MAEHEVLRAAAEGLPVSIVLPTFPLGPGDRTPTPTGRLVLDYLNGRVPAYVDTVLNVVHVDDVARGHVLALECGAVGRSYILGGENYSLKRLLSELAAMTGLREPTLQVPRAVSLAAAWVSETVEGRLLRRHPAIPLEAARMSTTRMAFDDSRARRELGYSPRPASEAIEASARWFLDNGFVSDKRRALVTGPGVETSTRCPPANPPGVDDQTGRPAETVVMTFTDYAIDIALIGLVALQIRGRRLTVKSLLLPVVLVAWAATELPARHSHRRQRPRPRGRRRPRRDHPRRAVRTLHHREAGARWPTLRQGRRAGRILWVAGVGTRFAFQLYATHGGSGRHRPVLPAARDHQRRSLGGGPSAHGDRRGLGPDRRARRARLHPLAVALPPPAEHDWRQ